ncbi:Stp1/IreP family PP2C-type Ser/Thr phosphatase [Defluviitalea raffinosedens]|jgi:protein phosphatase|uniref:Stp1/IreP family PP2C-type Ser/Thr phosphatase n=1 Tax=Defluviitalea raffinosedens TaxID=1450156 RepID=A0A7C8LJR5_9FIRM|nr:Stp1/IreP family PP2C-type Ser/Thr phosphatase [Defluviitalea raffinosedens]KAE9637202.1 Stp1/IreP family PP2C-type Ser/Thr phosphatase [Defluviitalea raffinosedens]MBM7685500.1 protein phosphatase [Defluviitalea raffinosedens]HHW66771.1 Stp1/IreP family PP2C-type Ser/Thr phosphatase [Candidatus Epulonipiscium sp.]
MISAGRCDKGKHRENNEDAIFIYDSQFGCLPNLYIVADGMGGHRAGEYASSLAIQSFCDYVHEHRNDVISNDNIQEFLTNAIAHTNNIVFEKAMQNELYKGMGTTFLVAVLMEDIIHVAHVGDSRLYIIGKDEIHQLTLDHSFVEEMVRKGTISEEEALNHPKRHAITRAVGTNPTVDVDVYTSKIEEESIILMCSDGLSNMLNNEEIIHIVKIKDNLDEIAQTLVDKANENGGLDNISVIIIRGTKGR